MKRGLILTISLVFYACTYQAYGFKQPTTATPVKAIQLSSGVNTFLLYSGIVNVPLTAFSYTPSPYLISIKNVELQNCNDSPGSPATYTATAFISDTTASRNDNSVDNRCSLENVAIQSVEVSAVSVSNKTITVQLKAMTVKGGKANSGSVFSKKHHDCYDTRYQTNSLTGQPLMNHVELNVYYSVNVGS